MRFIDYCQLKKKVIFLLVHYVVLIWLWQSPHNSFLEKIDIFEIHFHFFIQECFSYLLEPTAFINLIDLLGLAIHWELWQLRDRRMVHLRFYCSQSIFFFLWVAQEHYFFVLLIAQQFH
jgi:hypothetical protein